MILIASRHERFVSNLHDIGDGRTDYNQVTTLSIEVQGLDHFLRIEAQTDIDFL
jgi:hypothetical protein